MKKKKKLLKRILSFVLAINLVIVNVCFDGLIPEGGLFNRLFNTTMTAEAAYEPTITDPNNPAFNTTNGEISLNYANFLDYAYHYHNNSTFAASHQDDKITFAFGTIDELGVDYIPLGTEANPFNGSLKFLVAEGVTTYTLKINTPLFDYLSDDAAIGGNITLNLFNMTAGNVILANHVKNADSNAGNGTADWNIEIDHQYGNYSSTSSESYAGVIGEMMSGASATLRFTDHLSTAVSSAGYTGMICDLMDENSSITLYLTRTTDAYNVTSTGDDSAAGALVGKMNSGAVLTLAKLPSISTSSAVTASGSGSYAGGLVGEAEDATVTVKTGGMTVGSTSGATVIPIGGSVTGTTGAGGLFGHYTNSASAFDLKDYNITATVYAQNCGGVFGVLENKKGTSETAVELTIQNTGDAGTVSVNSGSDSTYATTGYFGGIIGKYITDDLKNSLILDSFSVSSTANASFDSFGGVIGIVDSTAYVKADGVSATATGSAQGDSGGFFGGLVGKTATANGVFVDLGDFTLSADSSGFKGGGVVGNFNNGVLRLSGTTDMSSAKSLNGGQLVGVNDNVLVYAIGTGSNYTAAVKDAETGEITTPASGWTFKRSNSSQADDIGTWGEVVRIANIEDATNGVLTLDSANHTVTIKAAQTSMSTPSDFVKTALNIQLNQGSDYDCLQFVKDNNDVVDTSNTRTMLLASTSLSFGADISLAGTGITGFMRDGGDSVGTFTGTLAGGSKTVTLAIGEKYGKTSAGAIIDSSTTGEGLGQIYRHPYNGLFAVIGDGTTGTGNVNSLTIGGTINVRNKIDGMNIGGIAAISKGNTSLSNITASQTVNYGELSSVTGTEAAGKNIGGLIGLANGTDNGTIAITGTNTISTVFNISDNFASWNSLGAFIGKVTSPKFTINIAQGNGDSLTVSHRMVDINKSENNTGFTAGGNTDGGGLIGYITSGTYSNRKINIKNLDFNNCTIINKASTNAGGFLGYAWLDTDTTIDGLTVTNGTITNTTPNVGVMCYVATGRWTVDDLTITKMNLSGGAGTSLGMLVNKAYNGSKGLYLNVLNAGYTLTNKTTDSGITLPNTLGVYDELAAYSAEDVIKGTNAGVISINMNGGRHNPEASPADGYNEAKTTVTGTYQNKLTNASSTALGNSKYANANSRYYYNVDVLDKTDKGHSLLLWSLNKYAASNINGLFTSAISSNKLTGTANMTGLSFYPLYAMPSGTSINGLTLTMDYSGIFSTAETVDNSDSYVRDPGDANQHYLMHSGLFITQSEGTNLSIGGTNTFSGNFLQLAASESDVGYNGLLVSRVSNGSLTSSSRSEIILDGITPKTTNNASYDDGYLLVNKITRETNIKPSVSVYLEGISTTNAYSTNSTTATVAKSLIGNIEGPAIDVEFSKIKLDSRVSGTLSGNSNLKTAYGTDSSIFTDSTLLASLKTTSNAQLRYYYTYAEDWDGDRWVTYGQEVENSIEYSGKEEKYYGSEYFTDPVTSARSTGTVYPFATGFLRYVKTTYNNSNPDTYGSYYRELKVNVTSVGLTDGCGTYNDPYIITNGEQLASVAKLLNSTNASDLANICLPLAEKNGVSANYAGNRWCDNDHALFTGSGSNYTCDSDGTKTWSLDNVKLYLANAYYKIGSNVTITLPSTYSGLGGTDSSGKYAFRGVIVGSATAGVPNCTITNNSSEPFVKVSNGCVLKDIKVVQNVDVSIAGPSSPAIASAYFGYTSACNYYGGLIGEIMGGDNIIDNSYVEFGTHTVALTGDYATVVPVGGYVGVVVHGGLIFKNMDASKTTIAKTGLNVYKETNVAATTHAFTEDVANLDGKSVLFNHGSYGSATNFYMTSTVKKKETNRDGFETNSSCAKAVSIVFEREEGTTDQYYLKMEIEGDNNYLQLYNDTDKGGLRLAHKGDIGTLFTVEKTGSTYSFKSYLNKYYYINWNSSRGFCGANQWYADNAIYLEEFDEIEFYNLTDDSDQEAWAAIYVNPIVGRVINGYAINETETDSDKNTTGRFSVTENSYYHSDTEKSRTGNVHSLQNGIKHYSIADVNKSETNKLEVTAVTDSADGTIKIPNAQAFFILSLITQSCAGTAETAAGEYVTSLSYGTNTISNKTYVYGMSHNADYTKVGSATAQTDDDYVLTSNDTAANTAVPYVIKWYTDTTDGTTARCVTTSLGYYDITLNGTDTTYQLPDSFRGLGCVGNYNDLYVMKVEQFNGNGKTIDEDIYLNKYQTDNYFNNLHKGTTQLVQNNLETYSVNNEALNHGVGLFDAIKTKDTSSSISNFTLTGSVNTEIFDNSYKASSQELALYNNNDTRWLSVGGVVGTGFNESNIIFNNITLDGASICGSCAVGGILGYSCNKGDYLISIVSCRTDNTHGLSIKMNSSSAMDDSGKARNSIGGLVGKCYEGKVNIYGTSAKENNTTLSNYTTVKLASFGYEQTTTADYRCCAGGLVGFAGDGCQAYDMYVVSNDSSSPVTVGGSKIYYAGGICGGMQSRDDGNTIANYTPTCYAIFKNCTVDNINVEGQMVGGLYGGKWGSTGWTPYSITVDNCKMVGDSTSKNTIKAAKVYNNDIYAGGLIGRGLVLTNGNPNIHIKDSTVSNYNISGLYCGGFIGYAGSYANNTTITCYIHDSSVEDCVIGASGNNAGGAIGHVQPKSSSTAAGTTANKMLGYNIKLDNVTSNSSNMGAWIGKLEKGKTSIQFTGIGIYENGFAGNVGTTADGASLSDLSFVFADYNGLCNGTTANDVTTYPTDVSTFNNTHNVDMPKYPYVTINPQSSVGSNQIISGDGAMLLSSDVSGFTGTGSKTMAAKIYSEYGTSGTDQQYYNTFGNATIKDSDTIDDYMNRSINDGGDRISTWETETQTELTGVEDFAMIVIANEDPVETTKLISRYIQLVTNTATDYSISSEYYDVVPSACVYNSTTQNFEITNGTASIAYTPGATSSNAFTVVRAGADSLATNKFTLLDVQFKDPLHTEKIAYHLYVPVYVNRSISATFSSTALTGTTALAGDYTTTFSAGNMLIENLDTWITTYIRYSYSITDIQALLDSGMLGWNGRKQVTLGFSNTATGTSLPNTTQLVLIDPNGNIDRAYYAQGSDLGGNTFSLSAFHSSYSGGSNFEERDFGDIIGGSVRVDSETGYYDLGTSNDYDIKVGDDYYKYVGVGEGDYNITATSVYNEDYYISMLIPSSEIVYLFDVKCPKSITGNMVTYVSEPINNYVSILLGDLYEYSFATHTVNSNENDTQITDTNNTIIVNVTSNVKLKSTNRSTYAGYLNANNKTLYHADVITLNRYYLGGSDTTLSGYGNITATCSVTNTSGASTTPAVQAVPSSSNITVSTGDIRSQVTNGYDAGNSYTGATITQSITIPFNNIDEEFPSRPEDQETQYGVSVSVTSNISYKNSDVAYSSKKAIFNDDKRYYIVNANTATLKYEANYELDSYDSVGSASYNYSRLGNNGLDRTLTCIWPDDAEGMPINATAMYNAAAVTNFEDATTIRYTLSLYKKTDVGTGTITSVEYQLVNINDYLEDVKLYGGTGGSTVLTKIAGQSDEQKYVYTESVDSANRDERLFTIGTYFEVITGGDFHDYANYRVVLEVSLLNSGGGVISNSVQRDHIVYTNAKIYPEVIQN